MVDALIGVVQNPWVGMWMSPRETIRRIVDHDPTYHVLTLGALAGGLAMLDAALAASVGTPPVVLPGWFISYLPICALLSPFVGGALGIAAVYLSGLLFLWAGRALGGVADAREVRAAAAWAGVPQICFGVAMLAALLGNGVMQALFPSLPPADPRVAAEAAREFTAGKGVAALVSLWSLVALVHALAEVHGFSAWRALGAFIAVLAIFALLALGFHAAIA
ncbi:MAG TPA: YIP1 family protein [Candidatus Binataceae bacterium]|jgi:hypothetical protein|nr:YIP1 family protein [Candidatus Binataceae bacterium]